MPNILRESQASDPQNRQSFPVTQEDHKAQLFTALLLLSDHDVIQTGGIRNFEFFNLSAPCLENNLPTRLGESSVSRIFLQVLPSWEEFFSREHEFASSELFKRIKFLSIHVL